MRQRAIFYSVVTALVVAGLVLSWMRYDQLDIPLIPKEQVPVWLIEARVDFDAIGDSVTVRLSLPDEPNGFELLTEQSASPGYGFSLIESDGEGRRGEWTIRSAEGPQSLYHKAQFIPVDDKRDGDRTPDATPEPRQTLWQEPEATAASELLAAAHRRSSSHASMARELIKLVDAPDRNQNAALLLDDAEPTQLLVRLLNQADIPAREAMGLELEDARRNQTLKPLIDVYADGQWQIFDPEDGSQSLPDNTLLWHRMGGPVLDVVGGQNSQVQFSMIQQTVPALDLAQTRFEDHGLGRFSLYHLPIEEQSMLKLLLLLPVGALVVAFMRIVIGLRTSGTFMPVLIALAFLQTSLVPGLIAFIGIVGLGLILRGYLSRLNLLLVSRIATMIVLVIFLTAIFSVVGHELGLNLGMTITFFPMIIIAWTIERMSILWEEEGASEVLVQGTGSLLVAVAAFAAMQWSLVGHLTYNFPEIHLIILALILLTGQYTGYKLSELYRFRAMTGDG